MEETLKLLIDILVFWFQAATFLAFGFGILFWLTIAITDIPPDNALGTPWIMDYAGDLWFVYCMATLVYFILSIVLICALDIYFV